MPPKRPQLCESPDGALLAALQEYGGLANELLQQPELRELFLPVLRADLAVDETYDYRPADPLSCPISVFGGTDDRLATPASLEAWRRETTGSFRLRLFDGGHFFIESSRAALLSAIAEDLMAICGSAEAGLPPDSGA